MTPEEALAREIAEAQRALDQRYSQMLAIAGNRDRLSRWHWRQRRALLARCRVQTSVLALDALAVPAAIARAAAPVTEALSAARRWGRTELGSPRQHVREAAAALLEAMGEPVAVPGGAQLLADLRDMLALAPPRPVAWDDLARVLKEHFVSRYPVLTGTQLRREALAAGVAEQMAVNGVTRRGGTSYAAVLAAIPDKD